MPSYLVHTLGCKLNQLESEAITDTFNRAGYNLSNGLSPSVVVINTCTVTSKADQKARRVIRKTLRDYPEAKVIVTGCYAQLNKDDLLGLDSDGRLSVTGKDNILEFIEKLNKKSVLPAPSKGHSQFQFNPQRFSSRTRSFLKIQDGCDNHCTYCRIRLARGQCISLEPEEVLSRLRILEKTHAEAVLTGVNISQYKFPGSTAGYGLPELLDYLLKGTEKIAIRLSSLAPDTIDAKIAKILSHKRIRPHFHLSVQSCSEKVLEKMGRSYNAETVENAAAILRRAKNDPFLACDIITGFPGETESEFSETLEVCRKTDFAWIHVFPYSKRPGTPAFNFTEKVKESEVTKRVELLTELAFKGRADYVNRWLGSEVDVLVEAPGKTKCRGITENYLKVLVQYRGEKPPSQGTVLRCKLTEAGDMEPPTSPNGRSFQVDIYAHAVVIGAPLARL